MAGTDKFNFVVLGIGLSAMSLYVYWYLLNKIEEITMMKSKNEKVQNFLDDIMMTDAEKHNSLIEMREIIFNIYPQVDERIMYGGILFSLNSEDFSGLFVRKNHISFEFSNGYIMKDPNQFLEGIGKFRRHLKIRTYADIKNKDVVYFVKQAV